jgi:exodeoxyribonuclease-3
MIKGMNLVDTFRYLHPETVKYSYWSNFFNSRAKNKGWRLDYFLISDKMKSRLKKSDILVDQMGSDHAPIILSFT